MSSQCGTGRSVLHHPIPSITISSSIDNTPPSKMKNELSRTQWHKKILSSIILLIAASALTITLIRSHSQNHYYNNNERISWTVTRRRRLQAGIPAPGGSSDYVAAPPQEADTPPVVAAAQQTAQEAQQQQPNPAAPESNPTPVEPLQQQQQPQPQPPQPQTMTTTAPPPPNDKWPEVAWLMAYPESGVGYITRIVQQLSGTCTATNYGPELGPTYTELPSHSRTESGPYRYTPDPFPPRFILTKTFCMGFCLSCPSAYAHDTTDFYRGCGLGSRVLDGKNPVVVRYPPEDGKRAVHLIRDPFDNVVVRFYAEWYRYKDNPAAYGKSGNAPGNSIWNYQFDPEGFRRWCDDLDSVARELEGRFKGADVATVVTGRGGISNGVPCYGQFYQYVHWHNSAFDMTAEYRIPNVVVHYDDFRDNVEGAIDTLFNFLDLPVTGTIPPFEHQRFPEFFNKEEIASVAAYIKVLASQPTWLALKRYLPPVPSEMTTTNGPYGPVGTALSKYYGKWPHLAWLISYPNSGTYFTTQAVQVGSQTTTATNYLPETGERYLDIPNYTFNKNGPFRTSKRLLPPKYILTKTHCAGHNYQSNPDNILTSHLEFMKGCGTGVSIRGDNGRRVSVRYRTSEVKKIVHLIRHPLDNVVARFHYLYKRYNSEDHSMRDSGSGWEYSHNPAGFKEYCADLDKEFDGLRITTFGAEVSTLARKVPCHGEFYQYVQWHNNAFKLPNILNIPSLVIRYEDYEKNLNDHLTKLFSFLEVSLTGFITPFQWNGGYGRYYTDEDKKNIKEFVMATCIEEACDIMRNYFEG